ncbi:hypothetical protein IB685_06670 [Francisella tularensis subsp. novicida FSC159]|uniref:hypothetical protein n=1 Tax=Francisella tularensis TaxID=263 RepID=UPI0005A565FD|nr:hypothetical protein [Francisella tularensis]AJI73341.1 hypothetical protein AQ14_708 [Francisella tularensis subsp. novicida D9876]MBK2111824.1 hypothetical protein [Francisella tularensis subsp. novicida FSC159]
MKEKDLRTRRTYVRLNRQELDLLEQKASYSNLDKSRYIRSKIFSEGELQIDKIEKEFELIRLNGFKKFTFLKYCSDKLKLPISNKKNIIPIFYKNACTTLKNNKLYKDRNFCHYLAHFITNIHMNPTDGKKIDNIKMSIYQKYIGNENFSAEISYFYDQLSKKLQIYKIKILDC